MALINLRLARPSSQERKGEAGEADQRQEEGCETRLTSGINSEIDIQRNLCADSIVRKRVVE